MITTPPPHSQFVRKEHHWEIRRKDAGCKCKHLVIQGWRSRHVQYLRQGSCFLDRRQALMNEDLLNNCIEVDPDVLVTIS